VVLRTADEMKAVVRENPYAKRSGMENFTGVMFLADLAARSASKASTRIAPVAMNMS
jgi:hypothetical protein